MTLAQRDLRLNWHPCSQMKDYETFQPLEVVAAQGSYIHLSDGRRIIDAMSSWWCKSLGHGHPAIKQAIQTQLEQFEHVIFANTTYEAITQLSERLAQLLPGLDKIFYAGDGSCAVEIALKMSLHYRLIAGQSNKTKFIALANGYHGETLATLSVSDLGLYKQPYETYLFTPQFIEPCYVTGEDDPQWHDASQAFAKFTAHMTDVEEVTALIMEPIIQGAGGMRVISADFLSRLCQWAKQHDIHVIADEIMTGIGRSGKMLACEHANIVPDFLCLSKGLTGGTLPMSAVLTSTAIYQAFYDDYETGKAFLHSHTYCGNALAAATAVAALNVVDQQQLYQRANDLQVIMREHMQTIQQQTGLIDNIRGVGAMVAADLVDVSVKRAGYQVFQQAVKLGALLRPLGNTIYWLPPLTIDQDTISALAGITQKAIQYVGVK